MARCVLTTDQTDHDLEDGPGEIESVLRELSDIRAGMIVNSAAAVRYLERVHENFRESARNLMHYLALRRHDLRPLQNRLAALGLSSLGRAESHVLATVDSVLAVLRRLAGGAFQPAPEACLTFTEGQRLLNEHTETLLGAETPGRHARIMVTMPREAADDYDLIYDLLKQGMDCLRINCAHDDEQIWARIIEHLRRAEQTLGRSCRVMMDLAGPKLRTGPLEPGPRVVRVRPKRDLIGRILAPARIWLTAAESPQAPPTPADACLSLPASWLALLRPGERLKLTDARAARRVLTVADVAEQGCWAEAVQTAYLIPGTTLSRDRPSAKDKERQATIGNLPAIENAIPLSRGDKLILTRDQQPGRPAKFDSGGNLLTPARIGCTIPDVFDDVRPGEAIWFDDGRIGGVVEKIEDRQVLVRVTQARMQGAKLRADKGINLPESNLQLPALTEKDLLDLSFAAKHADVIQLSFANSPSDVELLQQSLISLGERQPAVVLKIETQRGFRNLPEMLLTAMRASSCGVMIARGDLAVECGFERLAEVQEEILWICEAAHVPVIWATQVLESLAKEGIPSRAEITDAAMGHRAECVMLNKGPHMVTAVKVLDDILRRMHAHQAKKKSMLRELKLAHTLVSEP